MILKYIIGFTIWDKNLGMIVYTSLRWQVSNNLSEDVFLAVHLEY